VEFVQRKVEPALAGFRRCHAEFIDKLLRIKELVAGAESREDAFGE
jgi:hypothetical protein